jgi:amidase
MARCAEDLSLALDVAAGPDTGEDVAWRFALPAARRSRLADFRVAVLPSIPWVPLDAEIGTALDSLAAGLGRRGCQVKSVQPPELGDFRQHYALYLSLLTAVQLSRVPPEQRRVRLDVLRSRDDEWSRAAQRGAEGAAPDYIAWIGQREQVRAAWRAFFSEWDVLVAPSFFTPAYPHWDKPWPDTETSLKRTLDVNGKTVLEELGLFYPSVATVAGQPATAVPLGLTRGGLPIGVQLIGPYLEDRTPLRFAELLAQEFGGFTPPRGF